MHGAMDFLRGASSVPWVPLARKYHAFAVHSPCLTRRDALFTARYLDFCRGSSFALTYVRLQGPMLLS